MGHVYLIYRKSFKDNLTDTEFVAAVKAWMDGLNIPDSNTLHSVTQEHRQTGHWVVTLFVRD